MTRASSQRGQAAVSVEFRSGLIAGRDFTRQGSGGCALHGKVAKEEGPEQCSGPRGMGRGEREARVGEE